MRSNKQLALVLTLALLAACASTGDKKKDAALDHNAARIGFNKAVQGVTAAIREGEISKADGRKWIAPLVHEGQDLLDQVHASISKGEEPTVDIVSALLNITTKILAAQSRLAAEE